MERKWLLRVDEKGVICVVSHVSQLLISEMLKYDWLGRAKMAEIPKWRITSTSRAEKQIGKI